MTVAFLRESARRGYTVIGVTENGETKKYTIPSAYAKDFCRGYELSDDELSELVGLDTERRALDKAASLLSASDKSRAALLSRLISLGFPRDTAQRAVLECVRLGYLDEKRQLLRLVIREAEGSLRGPKYIMRKLAAKGYPPGEIRSAIEELTDSGELDFGALFSRLAEKKGVFDREELRILAYKYGYR